MEKQQLPGEYSFDPSPHLSFRDVSASGWSGHSIHHLWEVIYIKQSKTHQGWGIVVGHMGGLLCPMVTMLP